MATIYPYRNAPAEQAMYQEWENHSTGSVGVLRGVRYLRSLDDVLENGQMIRHTVRNDGTWYAKYSKRPNGYFQGGFVEALVQTNERGDILTWGAGANALRIFKNLSEFATAHKRNYYESIDRDLNGANENGWLTCEMRVTPNGNEWATLNVESDDQEGIVPRGRRLPVPPMAIVQPPVAVQPPVPPRPAHWGLRERLSGRIWTDAEHQAEDLNDPPVPPVRGGRPIVNRRVVPARWVANETIIDSPHPQDCGICMESFTQFTRRPCGHEMCDECNLNSRKAKIAGYWSGDNGIMTREQAYARATPCPICRAMN
jgi:hypothetical protein